MAKWKWEPGTEVALAKTEEDLGKQLGLTFRNPSLLKRALTHRSSQTGESNEVLEFLGDSILDFLVGEHLYLLFPQRDEGELTVLRSQLVNEASLAEAASVIGLGDLLILGEGEERTRGRRKPSILAGAYEALMAAVYLDQGLDRVRELITDTLLQKLSFSTPQGDPKSKLQEVALAIGKGYPRYRVLSEKGPDHRKTFRIEVLLEGVRYGSGTGRTKKEAEQKAAVQALAKLGED